MLCSLTGEINTFYSLYIYLFIFGDDYSFAKSLTHWSAELPSLHLSDVVSECAREQVNLPPSPISRSLRFAYSRVRKVGKKLLMFSIDKDLRTWQSLGCDAAFLYFPNNLQRTDRCNVMYAL